MSDSVRPHRQQPTRLLCPWDSPGKSTGVGCHFLLQCMKVKSESEVAQSCLTLSNPMDWSLPGSSVHGIFQARVLEWDAIAFSDIMYSPQFNLPSIPLRLMLPLSPFYGGRNWDTVRLSNLPQDSQLRTDGIGTQAHGFWLPCTYCLSH